MKISVELTLTPIQDDYEPLITDFIKRLRNSGFIILENPLSTHVYGDYEEVMDFLKEEIKTTMEAMDRGLLHLKLVKSDRSDYKPFF